MNKWSPTSGFVAGWAIKVVIAVTAIDVPGSILGAPVRLALHVLGTAARQFG